MSERARHTGDGVARRKAHQERQRDEREQREEADRAAGTALPPEEVTARPRSLLLFSRPNVSYCCWGAPLLFCCYC